MSEFNKRIASQREILRIINSSAWREELLGLSAGAIERWIRNNRLSADSELVQLIRRAASALFFLANKSQEQISEEYELLEHEVTGLTAQITRVLRSQN